MSSPTPTGGGAASGTATGTGGSSHGRGGGRGRGGRRHGGRSTEKSSTAVAAAKFKGNTADMNGHVFQCFTENDTSNQFAKTIEVLRQYIAKNMKFSGDLSVLTKDLEQPVLVAPERIDADADDMARIIWQQNVIDFSKRRNQLDDNLKAVHAIVWGQCSEAMRAKIKQRHEFETRDAASDCGWLLKEIKGVMMRFEGQRKLTHSLDEATTKLYSYRQGPDMTCQTYREEFTTMVDTIEHYGGVFSPHSYLFTVAPGETDAQKRKYVRDQWLATMFLRRADKRRFGGLIDDLENQYSRGNDQYPKDLTDAYHLLNSYVSTVANGRQNTTSQPHTAAPKSTASPDDSTGLTFAQTNSVVAGNDGATHRHITCYSCQKKGHYAENCPKAADSVGQQHFQASPSAPDDAECEHGLTFTSINGRDSVVIPPTWILLDSQSTVSVFCNKRLLHNVRPSATRLKVYTNGGHQVSTLLGDVTKFWDCLVQPRVFNEHPVACASAKKHAE